MLVGQAVAESTGIYSLVIALVLNFCHVMNVINYNSRIKNQLKTV